MGDFDESRAVAADRLFGRARCALRLDGLYEDHAAILGGAAERLGIVVLDGMPSASGRAPRILVADRDALERLGAELEVRGAASLGSAIRRAVEAYDRTAFTLAFADGGHMDLTQETRVMGILNVTPDSFSESKKLPSQRQAVEAAAAMLEEGADFIDVGGESTRPGAESVSEDEEARRVVPVIRAIKRDLAVRVSVDTTKAGVARLAIEAGADVVNDVSAFSDSKMLAVVRDGHVPVIVMHRRGTPKTMQQDTEYVDLLSSVVGFLRITVERASTAGIAEDKILVDPGLGFGKSAAGSLRILRELPTLRSLGRPVVIGASRKSFIGTALDLPVTDRLEGSMAIAAHAAWRGAHVIRVHDVGPTKRATRMIDAIRKA